MTDTARTDYIALGFTALERGDCQEAVNIFRRAQEKGVSTRSFVGLGLAFHRLGDPSAARWAFAKALDIEPSDRDANEWIERVGRPAVPEQTTEGRRCSFRVGQDFLQVKENGSWRRFFIKGINLGLGLPGYFPGEYPIHRETYRQWFRLMGELGVNSLRVYAVQTPGFYEALADHNEQGGRLYLFQGVWLELPEDGDFRGREFLEYAHRQIREAVDAVCGNADFPERPGLPHGAYRRDVSIWTAAFVVGREWESCAVRAFNGRHGRKRGGYAGSFLLVEDGLPFEQWAAETCDYVQSYEQSTYGITHPVTTINWPTLDPLIHPSESTYEEGLIRQGLQVATDTCNENEDVETFDPARIVSRRGAGFFATYHVYPYYPDFLNNDFLDTDNPYREYLSLLRRHHGHQPILIAEFGVPSSREATHWQRDGWHHGGHDEVSQGKINGHMMEAIRDTGLAGGMLFSWFDEWFKRNWVFLPYELPAERNPFWFNHQDAEQTYGLMAAYPGYPGKIVTLAGRREEWRDATLLQEKRGVAPLHRFGDGLDGARTLVRLSARHDEGFFYLCLETAEPVDFSAAHYLIGLDTCGAGAGETLLPFETNARSPVGLTFLIHLAGEAKSRILVSRSYDKYLNEGLPVRPVPSDTGEWVVMQNITNHRRISKDGTRFYPSRVFSMSGLRFGSLDPENPRFDSLADWHVSGTLLELRLPWGLLNVTDPSSRQVLWMDQGGAKTRTTDGIAAIAGSYRPSGEGLTARPTGGSTNLSDALPAGLGLNAIRRYRWDGWNHPLYHTYLKRSYYLYRDVLARMPE